MAKKGTVRVIGPIGKFSYLENGKRVNVDGLHLVDLVAQFTKLPTDTKEVVIEVGGMGGSVPVAKTMRGFIKMMGSRYDITTKQVDDIFSAHTIVFSAAPKRLAAKGINPETGKKYQFMVHQPWIGHLEGNADQIDAELQDLRVTEEEFAAIYQEDTGIEATTVTPLMKADSYFDADQAKDLKFATDIYPAYNQAAYNHKTMKKTTNTTLAQRVLVALGLAETDETVAAAPPAELMGKPVTIAGAKPVDGVYTVVGGVVTALEAVEEEQAEDAPAGGAPAASSKKKAPAAQSMTRDEVLALIAEATGKKKTKKSEDPDEEEEEEEDDAPASKTDKIALKVAEILKPALEQSIAGVKKTQRSSHVPVGYKPENRVEDAKEWDRSFKANEHGAMKKNDPEKWARLFYAKYGRMPNS